ncbi:MAG: DUF6040 family protein [Anaerostipes sp.]
MGKIYRKYCWDIISIMMAIMSTAIVVYIGIRCYVKDWQEERGYY